MRITAKDLTSEELDWLQRLNRGGGASLMLTVTMAERLKELGLAEEKLGGTGLSRAGKPVLAERLAAIRRRRGH